MLRTAVIAIALGALVAGCGRGGPEKPAVPPRPAAGPEAKKPLPAEQYVSESPVSVAKPLRMVFGDQIELVGITVPETVKRGEPFEVEQVWRCLATPDRNWRIALHFKRLDPLTRINWDHKPPLRTSQWKKDEYVYWKVRPIFPETAPLGGYQIEILPYVTIPGTEPEKLESLPLTDKGAAEAVRLEVLK